MSIKQITEQLYQGNIDDIYDRESNILDKDFFFDKNKIYSVVSVGQGRVSLTWRNDFNNLFRFYHIPLIEFSAHWPTIKKNRHWMRLSSDNEIIAAIELVYNLIRNKEKVFLHCDAGICRSVVIASAYLVRSKIYGTIEEAYKFVSGGDNFHYDHNPLLDDTKRVIESKYWEHEDFGEYIDCLNLVTLDAKRELI